MGSSISLTSRAMSPGRRWPARVAADERPGGQALDARRASPRDEPRGRHAAARPPRAAPRAEVGQPPSADTLGAAVARNAAAPAVLTTIDCYPPAMTDERAQNAIEGARRERGDRPYGILLVDDEAAIRESLELTLEDDYQVFTASSGERGLEVLEREEVALVIADQVMPGMTGTEFLERVNTRHPDTIRMLL